MSKKLLRRPPDLDHRDVAGFLDADIARMDPCSPSIRPQSRLRARRAALDDQRVDDGDAVALGVHDHRVEIDLGDVVGVVGGKVRQLHHQVGKRVDIGRRRAAKGAEQGARP